MKKKGLAGKDAFDRMNFLYQASALCSTFTSSGSRELVAYYGSIFRNVAKKSVVRAEPEIKRTLCKGCSSLLIPGDNAKVRLKKKPAPRLVWTCSRCSTLKRFGVRKDYKIWLERDESCVERNTFGSIRDQQVEQTDNDDKDVCSSAGSSQAVKLDDSKNI